MISPGPRNALPAILVRLAGFLGAVLLVASVAPPGIAHAHTFARTLTRLQLDAARNFEVTLKLDLDALALGADPGIAPEAAAQTLLDLTDAEFKAAGDGLVSMLSRRLRVRVDGKPVPYRISFPHARPRPERLGVEVFGLEARLEGRVPEGGKEIEFFASRAFPAIELTFVDEGTARN